MFIWLLLILFYYRYITLLSLISLLSLFCPSLLPLNTILFLPFFFYMSIEYPCRVYNFEAKNDDESIQCDLCDKWNHINCVNVSKKKCVKLKNDPLPWYCSFCKNEMPFFKNVKQWPKKLTSCRKSYIP